MIRVGFILLGLVMALCPTRVRGTYERLALKNPADHQYVVSIDDVTLDAFPSEYHNGTEPEDCDCEGLNEFPCWPCVRTGGTELPN